MGWKARRKYVVDGSSVYTKTPDSGIWIKQAVLVESCRILIPRLDDSVCAVGGGRRTRRRFAVRHHLQRSMQQPRQARAREMDAV
jgi:hypothetical protein